MAALIGLDEAATREVCAATGTTLANLNCPGQIVISGELDHIPAAVEAAKARGARKAIPLAVAGAYHSPLMQSAQPRLAAELASVRIQPQNVPVIANVTARPHGTMQSLLSEGFTRFIELGPGTALSGFMKRIHKGAQILNVADVPSLEATVTALTAPGN
jgi:[acyl-carrier-protein] S-malonyltransferase